MKSILILTLAVAQAAAVSPPYQARLETRATFKSGDPNVQELHDAAVRCLHGNLVDFTSSMQVLVEGGGYPNAWIETQPMGGEMFAKRNAQVGLNNQLIFMLGQRDDGRLPGMVVSGQTARRQGWDQDSPEGYRWMPEADIAADFEMLQGFCFPEPAWRIYHWMGRDRDYLARLYAALAGHDAYLWQTRDSNGDGILETWCVWDTGEDGAARLIRRGAPARWPFDQPPGTRGLPDPQDPADLRRYWHRGDDDTAPTLETLRVPFGSMDVMAYSYSARATLATIAAELGNGQADTWRRRAEAVRAKLAETLWDEERHACFDIDRHGNVLPELIHNNLRCMWYGIFSQSMADSFIKHHLLNPSEFWTPVPLPSVAIDEPLYRNASGNNWSGQPQGLTFQRAIGALERYDHVAEITLIGRELLPTLIRNGCRFTQQLDPLTGDPSGQKPDGYGPMALAALEYLSRMQGLHLRVDRGRIDWSVADPDNADFKATQRWGDRRFHLDCRDGFFTGSVDNRPVFKCRAGARVITDLDGELVSLAGISPQTETVELSVGGNTHAGDIEPNTFYHLTPKGFTAARRAPFDGLAGAGHRPQ